MHEYIEALETQLDACRMYLMTVMDTMTFDQILKARQLAKACESTKARKTELGGYRTASGGAWTHAGIPLLHLDVFERTATISSQVPALLATRRREQQQALVRELLSTLGNGAQIALDSY
jgi:hypothetical protein